LSLYREKVMPDIPEVTKMSIFYNGYYVYVLSTCGGDIRLSSLLRISDKECKKASPMIQNKQIKRECRSNDTEIKLILYHCVTLPL